MPPSLRSSKTRGPVFDEATGRWISRAEVAEIDFTAFAAIPAEMDPATKADLLARENAYSQELQRSGLPLFGT